MIKSLLSVCVGLALSSCVNKEKIITVSQRTTSSLKSVGTVGPAGEVVLFFRRGNFVEVRECANSTVLGSNAQEALEKCNVSKKLSYYKSDFESALKYALVYGNISNLPQDHQAMINQYKSNGVSLETYAAYIRRVNEINEFIKAYGAADANLLEKEALEKNINDNSNRINIISQIDSAISLTVKNIFNQNNLSIISYSENESKILYSLLNYLLKNPGPFVFNGKSKAFGEMLYKKMTSPTNPFIRCSIEVRNDCAKFWNGYYHTNFEKTDLSKACHKFWSTQVVGLFADLKEHIQDQVINGTCEEE